MVDCNPQAKPASVKPCNIQECPTNMDSDWSGSGSSSREVFNEINTILEDSHLLKSPKGASKGNPVNSRIEGDFSHNNEIEVDRSIKNHILVDDFYYDYNFIKFHEDLSYDFDGEGNGASDYSGIHLMQESNPNLDTVYSEGTSPSATTSLASNAMVPPTASTSKRPHSDQPEEDIVLAEDYFLPVGTTAKPRSPITRFSQKYETLDVPTQDSDTIQSALPTDEVPSEVTPDDATLNINTGHEPDHDLHREIQTDSDTTKVHGSQKDSKDVTTSDGEGEELLVQGHTNQQEEPTQQDLHVYEDTYTWNMAQTALPQSTTVKPVTSKLNVDFGAKVETPMEPFSSLDQRRITTPAPLPAWAENSYNKSTVPAMPWFKEYTASVPSVYPSQSPNSQPQATAEPVIVPLLPSSAFWTTSNWSAVSSPPLHNCETLKI